MKDRGLRESLMDSSDTVTLEGERAGAITLLNTLATAWPDNNDQQDIEEGLLACRNLETLTAEYEQGYLDTLETEGETDTPENFQFFVGGTTFELRKSRIFQTIDLFQALKHAHLYASNNNDSLATKFSQIGSQDDLTLLGQLISNELHSIGEAASRMPNGFEKDQKNELFKGAFPKMQEALLLTDTQGAQTIDFGINELFAHSLAMISDELEFITYVAIKSDLTHCDSYVGYKDYLSDLATHVGQLSDSLTPNAPEWGEPDDVPAPKRTLS